MIPAQQAYYAMVPSNDVQGQQQPGIVQPVSTPAAPATAPAPAAAKEEIAQPRNSVEAQKGLKNAKTAMKWGGRIYRIMTLF